MRQALKLHPDSHSTAATGIDVDIARPSPSDLVLQYVVTGRIGDLRLPQAASAARADGLWQHTCFEAFLRGEDGAAYYEFNFAPSRQWAAYRFIGFRDGMQVASELDAPAIDVQSGAELYRLRASLRLERSALLPGKAPWRLGLSAVIEEIGGRTSYWALAHPPGKADFHHPDSFACVLPAARP